MGELGGAGRSKGVQCTGKLKKVVKRSCLNNVALDLLQSHFSVIQSFISLQSGYKVLPY